MNKRPLLFIDRDGTLVKEPHDFQVDALHKIALVEGAIQALLKLKDHYRFILVSNQDGRGTPSFPEENFIKCHNFIMTLFSSQGITFEEELICPHFESDNCSCRKPKLGMVSHYLQNGLIDFKRSAFIGDRETDLIMAKSMGIRGLKIVDDKSWDNITKELLHNSQRTVTENRKTSETEITVRVNLDGDGKYEIDSGNGFFDHMLAQLSKHSSIDLSIKAKGDYHIDEHHTVEDVAIVLGSAIKKALGDKRGVERYGFLLPMDESLCQVAIDLSGRAAFNFSGIFPRESINGFSCEMVPHFFKTLSAELPAAIHIDVKGENAHHMVEAVFKSFAKALKQSIQISSNNTASTKGVL